jgi:hypothetical protein
MTPASLTGPIQGILKARRNPEVSDEHFLIALQAVVALAHVEGCMEAVKYVEAAAEASQAITKAAS